MSEYNADDLSTYSDYGHPGIAKKAIDLIKSGVDPNIKDDELEATPLIKTSIVINEHSLEVAKVLIEHGADVNKTNKYGENALYELVYHHRPGHFSYNQQLERAQFLIDNGVCIETYINDVCKSALMLAVSSGSKDMVLLLLKNGANKAVKTYDNQTLKELATQECFEEITSLL